MLSHGDRQEFVSCGSCRAQGWSCGWGQAPSQHLWWARAGMTLVHPSPATLPQGTGQQGTVSNLSFQSLQGKRPWGRARSPSWEGWGPGTSAFDWPLHFPRAPTLFLTDEIKFSNITIQVHVESSAQDQDLSWYNPQVDGVTSLENKSGGKSQASTQQSGGVWIQGALFFILVKDNEDTCQPLKGDWRDSKSPGEHLAAVRGLSG